MGRMPLASHKGNEIICKPALSDSNRVITTLSPAPCPSSQERCGRRNQDCGYLWGVVTGEGGREAPEMAFAHGGSGDMGKSFVKIH